MTDPTARLLDLVRRYPGDVSYAWEVIRAASSPDEPTPEDYIIEEAYRIVTQHALWAIERELLIEDIESKETQ